MENGPSDSPNSEMVRYWNEGAGLAWVAQQERLDRQVGPLGRYALARAGIAPGESVLDVGCGCGDTTLSIAEAVGTRGRVTAVDVSAPMLARAQQRARAVGLAARIEWLHADAQTAALGLARHHALFSRFGVMFFADPPAAFANLARALRPGGRLAFVCWQAREKNPWLTAPLRAIAPHVPLPAPPAPDAPGPFSLADAARVRTLLGGAGFRACEIEPVEEPMRLGADRSEEVVELFQQIGPVGQALREAGAGPELRTRVVAALHEVAEDFRVPGGFAAPAAAWIVTARRADR